MSIIGRNRLWLAALGFTAALSVPAWAGGSAGSGSGGAPKPPAKAPIGSQAAGSKVGGSKVGVRVGVGSKLGTTALGSTAAGSKAASSVKLGSQAATKTGSQAAGSTAKLGSQAATKTGSQAAGSTAKLGSTAAGSTAAGSKAATGLSLGSQAASRAAGSQAATASAAAATRGSKGAIATVVPTIKGRIPKMSSTSPGLLVVLTDGSGSMGHSFAGEASINKKDAVADAVNNLLEEFIQRNNVGGVIRPRMDVLLANYGERNGSSFAGKLAGKDIVSITDLADNFVEEMDVQDAQGNTITRPIWVRPEAGGQTPMGKAFANLRKTVGAWSRRPNAPHLVLAVHVTDGGFTDYDPSSELGQLAGEVTAKGGTLLMTNIHLSEHGSAANPVIFPDAADAAKLDAEGQLLFRMSSEVPPALAEALGTKPGARMMAYNASFEQFAKVFEAGSSAAAQ